MKLSDALKVVIVAGLALTGAAVQTTPSFAAGTAIPNNGLMPQPQTVNVAVRCADRSNAVKARRAPGRIEFQCVAHDHRH